MMAAFLFWMLMLLCCGFAAGYGGRAGRHVAVAYMAAVLLTIPASLINADWSHPQAAVMAVDLSLLTALIWIALRSDRWFPLWFAGFHLVAVSSHVASLFVPGYAAKIYFLLQSMWTLPMLLTLIIGVSLDRRAGLRDGSQRPAHP